MEITKKILVIVISGIIGAYLGATYAKELLPNHVQILYVAEDELMEQEFARVKNDEINQRQLFFGEIEKAVNLATTLPKTYQNTSTRVVYSASSVRGENVRSISKEIHEKIISELKKR